MGLAGAGGAAAATGEAEPEAAGLRTSAAEELLGYVRQFVGADTGAVVGYSDLQPAFAGGRPLI